MLIDLKQTKSWEDDFIPELNDLITVYNEVTRNVMV